MNVGCIQEKSREADEPALFPTVGRLV